MNLPLMVPKNELMYNRKMKPEPYRGERTQERDDSRVITKENKSKKEEKEETTK